MPSLVLHVVLALVLTSVLACQTGALVTVLRSHRALSTRRPTRITDLVWITIPVAVVLFLAARSWTIAFDLNRPAMAVVTPVEVSGRAVSPLTFHELIRLRMAAITPLPGAEPTTAVSIQRR